MMVEFYILYALLLLLVVVVYIALKRELDICQEYATDRLVKLLVRYIHIESRLDNLEESLSNILDYLEDQKPIEEEIVMVVKELTEQFEDTAEEEVPIETLFESLSSLVKKQGESLEIVIEKTIGAE